VFCDFFFFLAITAKPTEKNRTNQRPKEIRKNERQQDRTGRRGHCVKDKDLRLTGPKEKDMTPRHQKHGKETNSREFSHGIWKQGKPGIQIQEEMGTIR